VVSGAVLRPPVNATRLGTCHVPFPAVIATLRDIGFTGTLAVECRMRGEPGPALAACGAYLRGLLTAEKW